jgi:hypothetical protein
MSPPGTHGHHVHATVVTDTHTPTRLATARAERSDDARVTTHTKLLEAPT